MEGRLGRETRGGKSGILGGKVCAAAAWSLIGCAVQCRRQGTESGATPIGWNVTSNKRHRGHKRKWKKQSRFSVCTNAINRNVVSRSSEFAARRRSRILSLAAAMEIDAHRASDQSSIHRRPFWGSLLYLCTSSLVADYPFTSMWYKTRIGEWLGESPRHRTRTQTEQSTISLPCCFPVENITLIDVFVGGWMLC